MERFTISIDDKLAGDFAQWIADRGYANRSEAVRDLLRRELDQQRIVRSPKGHCVASLSYVFNHHELDLAERITGLQHDHHDLTVATMHAHLDHDHCLETVILQGEIGAVQRFADLICAERGVRHGQVNVISVERDKAPASRRTRRSEPAHGHTHDGKTPHRHLKPAT